MRCREKSITRQEYNNIIYYENDSIEISKRKITSRLYNVICVCVCYVSGLGSPKVFEEIIRLCLKLSKLKRYLFRPVYLVLRINISILFFVLPEGNGKEKVSPMTFYSLPKGTFFASTYREV